MNLEALNWNVVVAGYWNPAILTPAGIARRLFGLAEGTPILIEVPTDGLAPYHVRHEDLTVTAEMGRLAVSADAPRYDLLDRAREVAARAIDGLPETPLTAAGYNITMKVSDPPNELLAATACGIDALLSDAAFSIDSRGLRRSLKMGDGVLNLSIQQEKDVTVEFNFHRQSSNRDELIAWMKYPINEVEKTVSMVLEKVIRIPLGEVGK
jgi:hypothetical protein